MLCALPLLMGRWRVEAVDGDTVRIANRQRGLATTVPRKSITLVES